MRSIVLILICVVALCLIYEFAPTCSHQEFKEPEPVVKRDKNTYIVLSLSDDGIAKFYAVPKSEIDDLKPVNYNNYVYYFYAYGVFKKGVSNIFTGSESSIKLRNNSKEKQFVTNVRHGKYELVHSEPNYNFKSSVHGFSNKDYDLVVRTTH